MTPVLAPCPGEPHAESDARRDGSFVVDSDGEIGAAGRLLGDVLAGAVGVVRDTHRAVADRAFAAAGPVSEPVRVVHDAIAGGVYAIVGAAHARLCPG